MKNLAPSSEKSYAVLCHPLALCFFQCWAAMATYKFVKAVTIGVCTVFCVSIQRNQTEKD